MTLTRQVTPSAEVATGQLVQVWFGEHIVCAYHGDADTAARYADAMRRRFAGLRVTVAPSVATAISTAVPPLPRDERMWELTP